MLIHVLEIGSECCRVDYFAHHDELLLRFQMKIADATAHVTAPSARYKLSLSYGSSSCLGNAVDGCVALSASCRYC
jgi:hypothetical protein